MRPLAGFEESIHSIDTIVIRDEMEWWESDHIWVGGETHTDPWGTNIEIGRDMFALSHELAHVWLNHSIGDADPSHKFWVSTGQGSAAPETWHAGRDAAYVSVRRDPSL